METVKFLKMMAVAGALALGVSRGVTTAVLWSQAPSTISPSAIQSVVPIERPLAVIDFDRIGEMTWEEAIEAIQTPLEAQVYLDDHFSYPSSSIDNGRVDSFKTNHSDGKGVCYDYAMAAAALLSDNGYPPLVLLVKNHGVFLYREGDSYVALGNTPVMEGADSIEGLVGKISDITGVDYKTYAVFNLDDYYGDWWVGGDGSKSRSVSVPPWNLVPLAK